MNKEKEINLQEFQHKPLSFLFFVAREKRFWGVFLGVAVILGRVIVTGLSFVVKELTDLLNSFDGNFEEVYLYTFLLIALMFFSTAFFRISGFIGSRWMPKLEKSAAQMAFNYLVYHSSQYFANRLSGKLQNKIFNISQSIGSIFPIVFWNFLDLAIKLVVSVALAFTVNIVIGAIFVFFIFVSVTYSAIVARKLSLLSKEKANAASESRGGIVDTLVNILAVKQNVAIDREIEYNSKLLNEYKKKHTKSWIYFEKVLLISNILLLTMFAVLMVSAMYFWQQGVVSVGDIVMLIILISGLFGDLQFLSMSFNRFMEQYGQLKEGLEEVFAPYQIVDDKSVKKTTIIGGEIIFDKIDFQYEEDEKELVFKNLSLTIPQGQKVGLVGESGAGKSTFVNLLLRFVEPEEGKILIDNKDISCLRQDDLRKAIAYVPQEPLLFHRTLGDNIKYGNPNATKEEVEIAVKRAHAKEFIEKLPKQCETLVGERGVKLSGGQKQRIMIARAILKKAPILVLDEATSSLDSKSEKLIQYALEELMKNRTTIVIAHRLSTLKQMDRIIVFGSGAIVEDGTHEELLKNKGKYYELWKHQAGA